MLHNPVIQAIMDRRSIRSYNPEQITEKELQTILRCAILAPSARNKQPWHFAVVQDEDLLSEFEQAFRDEAHKSGDAGLQDIINDPDYDVRYKAPTLIVVCAQKSDALDVGLATENIALAAHSLGIGSVILGLPRLVFDGDQGNYFKDKMGVPEGSEPVISVALGYPKQGGSLPERNYCVISRA